MLKHLAFVVILICLLWGSTVQSQSPMQSHITTALKGLDDVQLVVRPSAPKEVMPLKEVFDTYRLNVKQRIPELQVQETSENWLELVYITVSGGGLVEISLYRWVTINATGKRVYAKVWEDKRLVTGNIDRNGLREGIDILLTSLGADFIRASQKEGKK